ncbi:MAG: hypothetical protein ACFFDT_19075, partial [Candidatus Hodarchaeota archaeon]
VRISRGLIFVLDGYASKYQEGYLHEASEWYERVVQWAPRATKLILINKNDMDCITPSELQETFGISKESQDRDNLLIKSVSAKTSTGIKDAWEWFTSKIQYMNPVQLKSLHLYYNAETEASIDLNLDPQSETAGDLLAALVLGMDSFIEESLSSSLSAVKIGQNVVVSIKKEDNFFCSVVIDPKDFAPRAQKIAETALDFVLQENLFRWKNEASIKIRCFLRENFPHDLPKEVRSKDEVWELTIHDNLEKIDPFLAKIWQLICEKRSIRSEEIVKSLQLSEDIQTRFQINRSLHQIAEKVQKNDGILQYTPFRFRGSHLSWHLFSPFEVNELKSDFILSGCRDLQEIQIVQTLREQSYTIKDLAEKIGYLNGNYEQLEAQIRDLANHLRRSVGHLVLFEEKQEKGIVWHLTDEARTIVG